MMRRLLLSVLIALCLGASVSSPAQAGDSGLDADDQGVDMWDRWSILPFAYYTPETSVGLGVAVIHSFPSPGDEPKQSRVGVGVIVTLEEQLILQLRSEVRYDDRLAVFLDTRYTRFPTRYFPASASADTPGEAYDEEAFATELEATWRVGSRWALGLHHRLRANGVLNVRAGGELAEGDIYGVDPYVMSGLGPLLAWDSRDRTFAPSRGFHGRLLVTAYDAALGADSTAIQARLDLRGYVPTWDGHVLAIRGYGAITGGRMPFQLQPRLGGPNTMRGWFEGQLRDNHALAVQLEYRAPLVWRFGLVGFVAVGQTSGTLGGFAWDEFKVSGGVGARFLLNAAQNLNLRVDVAYGADFAVYIDVFEAF